MNRSAWVTLVVVIAAGTVTAWHTYRLQTHHLSGLPEPDVKPVLLILSTLPTGLFLASALLRRQSVGTQLAVTLAAGVVAALRVCVMRFELSSEWTHGTGLFSAVAWVVGAGIAVVVAVVSAVAVAWEPARRQQRVVSRAEPGAAPGPVT
jgi:hypothetical protein